MTAQMPHNTRDSESWTVNRILGKHVESDQMRWPSCSPTLLGDPTLEIWMGKSRHAALLQNRLQPSEHRRCERRG